MFSQLSSFFSGLKKSKKPKKSQWYEGDGSGEYDDDDINPTYFSCLGKSGSSSEGNSRQRRLSKVASTQSLDKIGKQKSKNFGMIRGATSMLDLNSNKKSSKSSNKNISPKADLMGNFNFIESKDLIKAGVKSHRLGFGKFKKENTKENKESKEKQKSERLKRGASWRHAYKNGSITLETSSNGLPRVNTEDRFVIEKSSQSSSTSSQNTSNETRQARFNAAPKQYSSTIQLVNVPPEPLEMTGGLATTPYGSVLSVNSSTKVDKLSGQRDKENKLNEFSKKRTSVQRASSLQSPSETTISSPSQHPSFTVNSPNQRVNERTALTRSNLPPPPPPPTQSQVNQNTNNDGTPFSVLLRKGQSALDENQPNKICNGIHSKPSKTVLVKSTYIGGSCLDMTDSPNLQLQNKATFHTNQMRESNFTNPTNQRKASLKVEDLVQGMNLSELMKFSQGPVLSTPLPASRRPHQIDDDQQDYANNRKRKESLKTPPSQTHQSRNLAKPSSTPLLSNHIFNKKTEAFAKKAEYDADIRIHDSKTGLVYAKGKLLGKGGFAKCYEMKDLKNQKIYAGKIMSKQNLAKKNQMEKIVREIELHFCLSHKNVVGFHSFFEDNHSVYIILELCSRKSLVHILKHRKTLTEPEVRYYMKNLTEGVQYIHGQKIIHRDLKLGNMLLNSSMELKIADFGLATRVEYDGERKMSVCGTPNYIAPEVLQKAGYSYEADIWAMGCIMYAMLCGRPPFESSTLKETYTRIATNKYILPQHVSIAAKSLIRHLLTAEPYLRPTLERISMDNFFLDGFMPEELSPSTCDSRPKFPLTSINLNNEANKRINKTKNNQTTNDNLGNMAQSKNSRKSASQIITRAKTTEFESAASSNMKDEYSVGSAPSIPRNLDSSLKVQQAHPSHLHEALKCQLEILNDKKGEPLPNGAVGTSIQSGKNSKWSRGIGVCIMKWVDYSNKYGFGYQLSNGRVGILFLDGTKMLLLDENSYIQVESSNGEKSCFSTRSIPSHFQQKTTILLYFMKFMENHLVPGGSMQTTPARSSSIPIKENCQGASIFLKKWFRTEKAVVMHLTDGTLQVNFIKDHTKVVLNYEDGDHDNIFVTLVDSERQASTYPLKSLSSLGCTSDVIERLEYVSHMIESIISEEQKK